MKVLIISPKNKTVYNFRGDLIRDMVKKEIEVAVTGPNKDYVDDISELGVKKIFEIQLKKDRISLMGDIGYFFKLRKTIKEFGPDIVFSYTAKPIVYGSVAAGVTGVNKIYAMVEGLGRIYTSNDIKAKILRRVNKWLYKIAFLFCNKVIFLNYDDSELFLKMRILKNTKVAHIDGIGVNMNTFRPSPFPKIPTFLMVSRIIKEKGVLDFCEAAKYVKSLYPNSKFILLGGFDSSIGAIQPPVIKKYVEEGVIEYPGEVKNPIDYYQLSSVFVLPSYYREGLPRAIIEAMACGRPIITTDWTGCRDTVIDGENGFLVDIKNPAMLADKMRVFIEQPDLIESMGKKSYIRCQEKYDVDIINRNLFEILELT
ncbi:MAG: glycosyltransferase family 4 protein [Lachnospiraceae bacterium]|nr:glycosyltransferase family 4 protein [Lachnospiraceae bacterium]